MYTFKRTQKKTLVTATRSGICNIWRQIGTMGSLVALIMTLSCPLTVQAAPGEGGMPPYEGPFESSNIELLSQMTPFEDLGVVDGSGGFDAQWLMLSDIWGWTSPDTDDEYVIIGSTSGPVFVRVTEPTNPEYLGTIFLPPPPANDNSNSASDIKVYQNHAYFVSEDGSVGIQILDLTTLDSRDAVEPGSAEASLEPTAVYQEEGYFDSHNIAINEDTGFAYLFSVGKNEVEDPGFVNNSTVILDLKGNNGGFSIPTEVAQINQINIDDGDVSAHDGQVVTYDGPDTDYSNREILFSMNIVSNSSNEGIKAITGSISIFDVTDKDNIIRIVYVDVPKELHFAHNGWLSEDMRYLFVGDENWKTGPDFGTNSRIYILDIEDLDDPKFVEPFEYDFAIMVHNLFVKGDLIYHTAYTAGLRIVEIDTTGNDIQLEEIAFFDTEPRFGMDKDNKSHNVGLSGFGLWGVYPFFDSGTIAVTDRINGLFLFKLEEPEE